MASGCRHDGRHPRAVSALPLRGRPRRRPPLADLVLRRLDGAARGRVLDAAPSPGAALPADRAPAAERDPRRVGAAPRRAWHLRSDGAVPRTLIGLARVDAALRCAARLARQLLRVARAPALSGCPAPPVVADPPRARDVLRHRTAFLVAALP